MDEKQSETYEENRSNSVLRAIAIAIAITTTTYHWIMARDHRNYV